MLRALSFVINDKRYLWQSDTALDRFLNVLLDRVHVGQRSQTKKSRLRRQFGNEFFEMVVVEQVPERSFHCAPDVFSFEEGLNSGLGAVHLADVGVPISKAH